jgi:hypothetical protein
MFYVSVYYAMITTIKHINKLTYPSSHTVVIFSGGESG